MRLQRTPKEFQFEERGPAIVEIAIARAEALKHAENAFEKADVNGDGVIDKDEAMKIIDQAEGLKVSSLDTDEQRKFKVEEFFRSFDEDGDQNITKGEWIRFYAKLFDSVI